MEGGRVRRDGLGEGVGGGEESVRWEVRGGGCEVGGVEEGCEVEGSVR